MDKMKKKTVQGWMGVYENGLPYVNHGGYMQGPIMYFQKTKPKVFVKGQEILMTRFTIVYFLPKMSTKHP